MQPNKSLAKPKVIKVAVAVIHYQDLYLLGFRNSTQHQGNRYEFVGGKIEADETPKQALIREVKEEVGLDLSALEPNADGKVSITDSVIMTMNKLGRIRHDYGDKQVILSVFRVSLTTQQFNKWQHVSTGIEGQALAWVEKKDLIAGHYPLPEANKTILQWLSLDDKITITRTVADTVKLSHSDVYKSLNKSLYTKLAPSKSAKKFRGILQMTPNYNPKQCSLDKSCQIWLEYHKSHLAYQATVYLRHKLDCPVEANTIAKLIIAMVSARPDLKVIVGYEDGRRLQNYLQQNLSRGLIQGHGQQLESQGIMRHIIAQHLTQNQLISLTQQIQSVLMTGSLTESIAESITELNNLLASHLSPNLAITTSCHDEASVKAANCLARVCIATKFSPVIATFISPVNATTSHPNNEVLGWDRFGALTKSSDIPVIALGGLSPADLTQVRCHGGDKIAGIRQFMRDTVYAK